MDDAQREIVAFLSDPSSYPSGSGPVDIIETHASIVFLAGPHAYKLKRAVKYPYLDFSTAARRRAACTAELRRNRRTAPQLYLEVRAIGRRADGGIVWGRPGGDRQGDPSGDPGGPLDFVVVMRRFDQPDLLENVATTGGLSVPLCHALSAHIAGFHDKAEQCLDRGGNSAMAELVQTNIGVLRDCRSADFAAARLDRIEDGLRNELA